MNPKRICRIVIDTTLTAMIVVEMLIQFTGQFLHEVIGFAFFATVALHLALSSKWIAGTASSASAGKLGGRRMALAAVDALLALALVVLAISSIAISGLLADMGFAWPFGSYAIWATVHGASSYALCAFVVVHLAMHWVFLASALRVPYDPSRRKAIGAGVNAVAAVGALSLGVLAVGEALPRAASASPIDVTSADDNLGTPDADAGSSNASGAPSAADGTGGSGNATGADASQDAEAPADGDSSWKDTPSDATGPYGGADSPRHAHGGKKGHHGKTSDYADGAQYGNAPSQEGNAASGSTGAQDAGNSADEQDANGGADAQDANNGADGGPSISTAICTLCRKQCPLSAPRCNKPYEAGLLSA